MEVEKPPMRAILIAAGLAAFILPAQAQGACGPRDTVIAVLKDKYGERRHWAGFVGANETTAIMEIYKTPDGDPRNTWTIVFTYPDKRTCPMAAGRDLYPAPAPEGDPS